MLAFLTFALLSSTPSIPTPYSYELKSGLSLEPIVGSLIQDRDDPSSLSSGLRLSYLRNNLTDAFVTGEVTGYHDEIFTGNGTTPRHKFSVLGSVALYEIFHPTALRFAVGGGEEWRKVTHYSPVIFYRAGLGGYFSKWFGVFLDLEGDGFIRARGFSADLRLMGSLQFIL